MAGVCVAAAGGTGIGPRARWAARDTAGAVGVGVGVAGTGATLITVILSGYGVIEYVR